VYDAEGRFERLIRGLRASDPAVLREFVSQYGPALERLAARRIEPGFRRRVGPESIAQSVCRTFLRRAEGGEFEIADRDSLWGLLCAISLTKVREKERFHLREKRSLKREAPLEGGGLSPMPARGPTPEEEVLFTDQFAHLLGSLTEEQRSIIDLRLQGRTQSAIADALKVSERTIRRLMADLEARLEAALGES